MRRQKDYIANLKENLSMLNEALLWFNRSYEKCLKIGVKENYSEDEFDVFETLTSRYARVADILIQKVFRSIDAVEFESGGTMIDVFNRTHKRGLFESVDEIRQIKDLRNDIAHEYVLYDIKSIFSETFYFTPKLLDIVENTKKYCKKYL